MVVVVFADVAFVAVAYAIVVAVVDDGKNIFFRVSCLVGGVACAIVGVVGGCGRCCC